MMLCSLEALAAAIFACEIFLALGATTAVALVPSALGAACTGMLLTCGLLGVIAAQTLNDAFALLRVLIALLLSVSIMFFVVPRVEELANVLIDAYLLPHLAGSGSASAKELRHTLHFGEDALLCVLVAMICAGWILFSTVYWTHIRRGRVAERALRRFMKATPAVPFLSEPLLDSGWASSTPAAAGAATASSSRTCGHELDFGDAQAGDGGERREPGEEPVADGVAEPSPAPKDATDRAHSGEDPSAHQPRRDSSGGGPSREGQCLSGGWTEPDGSDESEGQDHVCAICLCPFEHGEPVRVLVCSHSFHKECIDRWILSMQLAADCPLCKRQLMEDYV